jgi:hypothetical protein
VAVGVRVIAVLIAVLAVVTNARAEPLGTHVAPWAPTGEVVEAGKVRFEYTVVAHVGAAVGVAPGLELRVGAGALIPPVQLYEADAALRGQLVRAGALRVTVGAQAMVASLDAASGRRWGGELGVGLYGARGHVAWTRRRFLGGAEAIDVDLRPRDRPGAVAVPPRPRPWGRCRRARAARPRPGAPRRAGAGGSRPACSSTAAASAARSAAGALRRLPAGAAAVPDRLIPWTL